MSLSGRYKGCMPQVMDFMNVQKIKQLVVGSSCVASRVEGSLMQLALHLKLVSLPMVRHFGTQGFEDTGFFTSFLACILIGYRSSRYL